MKPMKYSVVIVDDNSLIRKSLEQTIQWEKYDCYVAGDASDGLQGIELIDRLKPTIVITDIKMPQVDGIELSDYALKKYPNTKIIIISGYQEFEYAKRAIKLGVVDLMLKPIDNQCLEDILEITVGKIKHDEELKMYHQQLLKENYSYKDHLENTLNDRRNAFIGEIIQQRKTLSEYSLLDFNELSLTKIKYLIFIMRVRSNDLNIIQNISKKFRDILYHYKNTDNFELCDTIINSDSVYMAIYDSQASVRFIMQNIKSILQKVCNDIKQQAEVRCCVSVSPISSDINALRNNFMSTYTVLNDGYFFATEDILSSSSHKIVNPEDSDLIINYLENFYRLFETLPQEEIKEEINIIICKIVESAKGNIFVIKCYISEICITLIRKYLTEIYEQNEFNQSVNDFIGEIDRLSDIDQVKKYLFQFVLNIKLNINNMQKINSPTARDAMLFITQNYNKDISLESVATHICISSSYLSRLLKKELGQNFIDILTSMRIHKAKQLLDIPQSRVIEVCQEVGYKEYTYFYQVFKRIEGISPSEYKKRGQKN